MSKCTLLDSDKMLWLYVKTSHYTKLCSFKQLIKTHLEGIHPDNKTASISTNVMFQLCGHFRSSTAAFLSHQPQPLAITE